jgi:hypothetical protein
MYNVQRWAGEQVFTMKREVVDRPSVVSDYLVQNVEQNRVKDGASQFSELSCEFLQISRTVPYERITVTLGYHKLRARWIPKMLTGANGSGFDFLDSYHKDSDEFPSHTVTGD